MTRRDDQDERVEDRRADSAARSRRADRSGRCCTSPGGACGADCHSAVTSSGGSSPGGPRAALVPSFATFSHLPPRLCCGEVLEEGSSPQAAARAGHARAQPAGQLRGQRAPRPGRSWSRRSRNVRTAASLLVADAGDVPAREALRASPAAPRRRDALGAACRGPPACPPPGRPGAGCCWWRGPQIIAGHVEERERPRCSRMMLRIRLARRPTGAPPSVTTRSPAARLPSVRPPPATSNTTW